MNHDFVCFPDETIQYLCPCVCAMRIYGHMYLCIYTNRIYDPLHAASIMPITSTAPCMLASIPIQSEALCRLASIPIYSASCPRHRFVAVVYPLKKTLLCRQRYAVALIASTFTLLAASQLFRLVLIERDPALGCTAAPR